MIDSHAHLDDPAFENDLESVLQRARDAGLERILTIGTDAASSERARILAEKYPQVYFAPGIHPHEADRVSSVDALKDLARHPRAAAVGETGLDYFKNYATEENQKRLFERHLELALEVDKPISIHCRDAHGDAVAILRAHAPLRGVIHCFSGGPYEVEPYMALDFYLSIAGPVTYKNADRLREAVEEIPIERLLIETDCPLLAPQKYRGQRNEPAYVRYTAARIAEVRDLPVEEVVKATTENAKRLFGLY